MSASTASVTRPVAGGIWKAGLLAAGAAALANALLYSLAKGMGVSFLASMGPEGQTMAIPVGMVMFASIVGGVFGTAICHAFTRSNVRGFGRFRVVAVLFLFVSFAGPFSSGADGATKTILALMHVVAGVFTIGLLSRAVRPSR